MKKHGGAIVFVVLLMVVGFFSFKDELHIDIKNSRIFCRSTQ